MAGETMICSVCGATNQADNTRCESCGARLDAISQVELSAEEAEAKPGLDPLPLPAWSELVEVWA